MLYSLVTPQAATQDGCISFDAANDRVAWFVGLELGGGNFTPVRGDDCDMYPSAGFSLFGTKEEADQWISTTFGDINHWKTQNQTEIIEAFDSFMYSKPANRGDTGSVLARIADSPSLGNSTAEKIVNQARGIANVMAAEHYKEQVNVEANKPSTNTLDYSRNFTQQSFPADETIVFSQPEQKSRPPWYD
jgi:hypothetical protein